MAAPGRPAWSTVARSGSQLIIYKDRRRALGRKVPDKDFPQSHVGRPGFPCRADGELLRESSPGAGRRAERPRTACASRRGPVFSVPRL